jgi:chondroitinase B-like protein/dockerin type I repeat protein/PEP-CTERM motif-containing protein
LKKMMVVSTIVRVCRAVQFAVAALIAVLCNDAAGTEFVVSSAAQISTAMQTAQPGDILTMTDGTWTNQRIQFGGFGTSGAPITLRAQTPGQVVLNGNSKINISGDWLVVDGLKFAGGALGADDHIVEFRGNKGEATNSRLTNSAIVDYNPTSVDTRYFWVSMYGQHNRVDHNYFKNQTHSGVTVVVWRADLGPDYHEIGFNYFAGRPVPINPSDANGFETIRIGTSTDSLTDSFTVVENNLFEHVDGEIEAISNKSSHNTFRYNTFREMAATLTLRHGNDNRVEGNFFLGQNTNNSGAIRVIGERQTIVNNYIADVDDRAGGAISISAGVPSSPLNGYYQVKDAVIAHNTVVNVGGPAITFDDGLGSSGRTLLAENVRLANNLLRSNGPAIFEGNQGTGWTVLGNIAFGGGLGPLAGNPGVSVVDPQLQLGADGLWRPGPVSPAINGGAGDYSGTITMDMDGQARIGIYDVGADEVSGATIVRRPLTPADVGPSWQVVTPPPPPPPGGGGCNVSGCALQAENYATILDPDGDGSIFTKLSVSTALGGQVIKAPNGSTVAPPPQETMATYAMTFQTAGTYSAYYRVRGFNGSTDSIFAPDGFAVDPDNSIATSQDSLFTWKKDSRTFPISAANVGAPLEFRLGMREQQAEIDALVLNLSSSLTGSQLDALFAVLLGDYNGDGAVGAADYTVWRNAFGSAVAAWSGADGNGDGTVNELDYDVWRAHFGATSGSGTSAEQGAVAAVPEPESLMLICIALLAWAFSRKCAALSAHDRSATRN